jgi:hypothetical protein
LWTTEETFISNTISLLFAIESPIESPFITLLIDTYKVNTSVEVPKKSPVIIPAEIEYSDSESEEEPLVPPQKEPTISKTQKTFERFLSDDSGPGNRS